MEKQILTILAMMLFSAAADLFGATSITYEQTQWTVTQMTDQSYVTGGIFPYSYDTKASYYMLHLAGKVDLQDINTEAISSLTVNITPDANGYYFVSADSTKAKITYTIEVFVRSRLVNAYADTDIAVTGADFGGSGTYGYDDIQGSNSTQNVKFVWLKDESAVSIPIPLENAAGTKYKNTHVDILIVFDRNYSNVLTDDYSTTFYCNYTMDNSDVHTFPFTILGTGAQEEQDGQTVKDHTFNVTALALADQYPLDDADTIASYQSVANVSYTADMTGKVHTAPSIADSLYEIVLSPTSDYTATGTFRFVSTKDPSVTIPYYVTMDSTQTATLFMSDVATYRDVYTQTSENLSGDEYYSYAYGTSPRRYVVVPMVLSGSDTGGDYSTKYSYSGDIKIRIPDDVVYGDTGVSYQQALADNATGGYFNAGTFRSTIYVSLVSQF